MGTAADGRQDVLGERDVMDMTGPPNPQLLLEPVIDQSG